MDGRRSFGFLNFMREKQGRRIVQMSKKFDDKRQPAQAAESNDDQKEMGLTLTTKQSWLLVIGILILFGALLFFGYKDWQRQYRMRLEFEEHLRNLPTSKADEEKGARTFLSAIRTWTESPHSPQNMESVRI
jgi:hypothetical protein